MPFTRLAGKSLVYPTALDPQWILPEEDTYGWAFRSFVDGTTTYRGGGGLTDASFWFNDENYSIVGKVAHFIPASDFRIKEPQMFVIRPAIHASGVLRANSRGRALFEEPALRCSLRAHLGVKWTGGGPLMAYSGNEVLIDIHRRANVRSERPFIGPERRPLVPAYVWLDGRQSLAITVTFTFDIWRDASGEFIFDGIAPDNRFRISVPPWSVDPLDPSSFD